MPKSSRNKLYGALIETLLTQLKGAVKVCEIAMEREDKIPALDTCLDRLFVAQAEVAEAYAREWYRLETDWFDHRFDWLQGMGWRLWQERGTVGQWCVSDGVRVLDLCCGDGAYAGLFFNQGAKLVHGIDRSEWAISVARRYYKRDNVEFFCQNVMGEWPLAEYDVIACFAAIEHFSVSDGRKLLERVAQTLSAGGVFVGSTCLELGPGCSGHVAHKVSFASEEEVNDLLALHFGVVETWPTDWGQRTDVYFVCE